VAEATSVPVPKVFGYDLRRDNNVGGPYMLMEMIHGETVAQRIKRQGGISGSEVQVILAQMADYLAQISSLRFDGLGRLRFNTDTECGPFLELFRSGTPLNPPSEYVVNAIHSRVRRQGISEKDLIDPPDHWTGANSREKKTIAVSIYRRTARVLASGFTPGPFPLQHPDLNQQNIILDNEGHVIGILDWEDAKVVPFESYDILSRRLFKQQWQVWDGLDWADEFAFFAFEKVESDKASKLSLIHQSPMGEVGRKIDPLAFLDFAGEVGELITFLFEYFGDQANQIVSKALAEEILGSNI
jgi:serine/threonine protein kinase